MKPIFAGLIALVLVAGCASSQVQTYSKPASPDRVFGGIKKVAVLPLDTLSEAGVGPKNVENMLIQRLLTLNTFDTVKEPRYVSALMKKLKLRNAESLDKEIVQKIGQELQVDAILVGTLLLFGEEEKSTNVEFSVYLNLLDVNTGEIVWAGSNFVRSSTTWSEVFGLAEAPSINELAVKGILAMANQLDAAVLDGRTAENQIIMKNATDAGTTEEEDSAKAPPEKETEELLLKIKPK